MSREAQYFTFATICIMAGSAIGGPMVVSNIMWGWFVIGIGVMAGLVLAYLALRVKMREAHVDDVATKIITVENYDYEFQKKGDQLILRLNPEITASPGVRVEDIQVELKGERYDTDWEPMKERISGNIGHYIYAELPKALKKGKYQARIIAYIDNKERPSEPFTVEYKDAKEIR